MWKKESQGNKGKIICLFPTGHGAIPFLAAPRGVGRGSGLGVSELLVDVFLL